MAREKIVFISGTTVKECLKFYKYKSTETELSASLYTSLINNKVNTTDLFTNNSNRNSKTGSNVTSSLKATLGGL